MNQQKEGNSLQEDDNLDLDEATEGQEAKKAETAGEEVDPIEELRAEVAKGIKAGESDDQLKKKVTMERYRNWAAYDMWRELNVQGMARHLREIGAD